MRKGTWSEVRLRERQNKSCDAADFFTDLRDTLNTTTHEAMRLEVLTSAKWMASKDLFDETLRVRDNLDRFSNLTFEIATMVKVLRLQFIGNMPSEEESLQDKVDIQ